MVGIIKKIQGKHFYLSMMIYVKSNIEREVFKSYEKDSFKFTFYLNLHLKIKFFGLIIL